MIKKIDSCWTPFKSSSIDSEWCLASLANLCKLLIFLRKPNLGEIRNWNRTTIDELKRIVSNQIKYSVGREEIFVIGYFVIGMKVLVFDFGLLKLKLLLKKAFKGFFQFQNSIYSQRTLIVKESWILT